MIQFLPFFCVLKTLFVSNLDVENMIYQRKALIELREWGGKKNRKPLIIRGARQVGKSTLVRMYGDEFDHFVEINLERDRDFINYFERYTKVEDLLNALYLAGHVPSLKEPFLLFIDEIQESEAAIKLLRYFYEERPDIYVIAAGSLLDVAIGKIKSFPVGRVTFYYLHPLCFSEYLQWTKKDRLLKVLTEVPLPVYAHAPLMEAYHEYALLGGMPEVVRTYVEEKSMDSLPAIYNDIWQAYINDIEKYATSRKEQQVLRFTIEAAANELDRINFSKFGGSNYKSREIGEAFRTLEAARVMYLIYPTTAVEFPVNTDLGRRPRVQLLDSGLLAHLLGIQSELVKIEDLESIKRGLLLQHLLTQEMTALNSTIHKKPKFWVRENSNANSEVDFVREHGKLVIPIEAKSGASGRLRSLHEFVNRSPHPYAIRLLNNTFSVEEQVTPAGERYYLMNLPYYLMEQIDRYIAYFTTNYQ